MHTYAPIDLCICTHRCTRTCVVHEFVDVSVCLSVCLLPATLPVCSMDVRVSVCASVSE